MAGKPYIIGLTGGSCSGKSSVAKRLTSIDDRIVIVDCDKLGHEAYKCGTPCYEKMKAHFGDRIIAEDGSINRPELGKIVFNDKSELGRV